MLKQADTNMSLNTTHISSIHTLFSGHLSKFTWVSHWSLPKPLDIAGAIFIQQMRPDAKALKAYNPVSQMLVISTEPIVLLLIFV